MKVIKALITFFVVAVLLLGDANAANDGEKPKNKLVDKVLKFVGSIKKKVSGWKSKSSPAPLTTEEPVTGETEQVETEEEAVPEEEIEETSSEEVTTDETTPDSSEESEASTEEL